MGVNMKGSYLKIMPEIMQANANKILPTKLSIKIAKLNIETETNISIYKSVLNNIIDECAEKDKLGVPKIDNDGIITLKEDKVNSWMDNILEEAKELMNCFDDFNYNKYKVELERIDNKLEEIKRNIEMNLKNIL